VLNQRKDKGVPKDPFPANDNYKAIVPNLKDYCKRRDLFVAKDTVHKSAVTDFNTAADKSNTDKAERSVTLMQ
jgi:hypothetical protein